MKHKALLTMSVLPFLLCSCGGNPYVGSYTFQMGKNNSTHMTVNMKITDQVVKESSGEELGKKFTIYGEASFSDASEQSDTSGIYNLLKDGLELNGYYNLKDKTPDGGNVLSIGFVLDDIESATGISFPISDEMVEKFIYSEINSKQINIYVPVSMEDLQLQLFWYGLDIVYDDQGTPTFSDAVEHKIGTHPTSAEIEEINQTYPDNHDGKKYRDYHTLTLPLLKD